MPFQLRNFYLLVASAQNSYTIIFPTYLLFRFGNEPLGIIVIINQEKHLKNFDLKTSILTMIT